MPFSSGFGNSFAGPMLEQFDWRAKLLFPSCSMRKPCNMTSRNASGSSQPGLPFAASSSLRLSHTTQGSASCGSSSPSSRRRAAEPVPRQSLDVDLDCGPRRRGDTPSTQGPRFAKASRRYPFADACIDRLRILYRLSFDPIERSSCKSLSDNLSGKRYKDTRAALGHLSPSETKIRPPLAASPDKCRERHA